MTVTWCPDGWRLIPMGELPEGVGLLAPEAFRCSPCHRRDASPWVAIAGYSEAIVQAGCEAAARIAMHRRLYRSAGYVQFAEDPRAARITARPAHPTDIARFAQMVRQLEAGARG